MISLAEIIAVVSILVLMFFGYKTVALKRKQTKLLALLIQAEIDKDILNNQMLQTIEDKKLVESKEFMMFLNQSREAAFSYIEEAQAGILKFNDALFDAKIDGTTSDEVLTRILDANKELQKLLPDNIKNDNVQGEL